MSSLWNRIKSIEKPWPKPNLWWRVLVGLTYTYSIIEVAKWLDRHRVQVRMKKFVKETPETDMEGVLVQRYIGQYNKPIHSQGYQVFKTYYYTINKMYDHEDLHSRMEQMSMKHQVAELKKKTH